MSDLERVAELDEETGATSIHPLADFDDDVRDLEHEREITRLSYRQRLWLEIMCRDTGDAADPTKRAESELRRQDLRNLSLKIVQDLEAQGIECFRVDDVVIWVQGLHSGIVDVPPRFRRLTLLPAVAAQLRQPVLDAVGYFTQLRPMARTAVFTTGPRTKLSELRPVIQELNRNLSKLNYELRKRFAVEIALRSNELGSPEYDETGAARADAGEIARDLDGEPTFHVHAHVIMHHLGGQPLSREQWSELLRFIGERWPAWWKDCGVIEDPRELVKYITKPREIALLMPAEKARLYHQLLGLKMLQPMGALRKEIRSRRERLFTLDRVPTPEGRVWREVPDLNRRSPRRRAPDDDAALFEALLRHKGDPMKVRDAERPQIGQQCVKQPLVKELEARCAAILRPGYMPGSLLREPRAVFFGPLVDATAADRDERCQFWRKATEQEWTAGRRLAEAAAAIRVHTCTPTVHGSGVPAGTAGRPKNGSKTVADGPPATAGPPLEAVGSPFF